MRTADFRDCYVTSENIFMNLTGFCESLNFRMSKLYIIVKRTQKIRSHLYLEAQLQALSLQDLNLALKRGAYKEIKQNLEELWETQVAVKRFKRTRNGLCKLFSPLATVKRTDYRSFGGFLQWTHAIRHGLLLNQSHLKGKTTSGLISAYCVYAKLYLIV